jgi:hypothetical protein
MSSTYRRLPPAVLNVVRLNESETISDSALVPIAIESLAPRIESTVTGAAVTSGGVAGIVTGVSFAGAVTAGRARGGVGKSFGVMMITSATRISARTVRLSIYVVSRSGHWIVATRSKGVTSANAFGGKDGSLPSAMSFKCLEGILRARGIIPACSRK